MRLEFAEVNGPRSFAVGKGTAERVPLAIGCVEGSRSGRFGNGGPVIWDDGGVGIFEDPIRCRWLEAVASTMIAPDHVRITQLIRGPTRSPGVQ